MWISSFVCNFNKCILKAAKSRYYKTLQIRCRIISVYVFPDTKFLLFSRFKVFVCGSKRRLFPIRLVAACVNGNMKLKLFGFVMNPESFALVYRLSLNLCRSAGGFDTPGYFKPARASSVSKANDVWDFCRFYIFQNKCILKVILAKPFYKRINIWTGHIPTFYYL